MLIRRSVVSLVCSAIGAVGMAVAQSPDQEVEEAAIRDDFPQMVTLPSSGGIEWVAPGAESKSLSDLLADFATGSAQVSRENGAVINIHTASHAIEIDSLSGRVRITQGGGQSPIEEAQNFLTIQPIEGLFGTDWDAADWDARDLDLSYLDECDEGEPCGIAIVRGNNFSPCEDDDHECQRRWDQCLVTTPPCEWEGVRLRVGDPRPWITWDLQTDLQEMRVVPDIIEPTIGHEGLQ